MKGEIDPLLIDPAGELPRFVAKQPQRILADVASAALNKKGAHDAFRDFRSDAEFAQCFSRRGAALGSGSFGSVSAVDVLPLGAELVRRRFPDAAAIPELVVKDMRGLARAYNAEQAAREGRSDLQHPGIVRNVASFVTRSRSGEPVEAHLVIERAMGFDGDDGFGDNFECASRGDFWRFVKCAEGRSLSELAWKAVAVQLVSALCYLHSNGGMHRDLKAENLLVFGARDFAGSRVPIVKIADLGTLKIVPVEHRMLPLGRTNTSAIADGRGADGSVAGKYLGSFQYLAPELLNVLSQRGDHHRVEHGQFDAASNKIFADYGHEVDVYSMGVTLFFFLSGGCLPFRREGKDGQMREELQLPGASDPATEVRAYADLKAEVNNNRIRWQLLNRQGQVPASGDCLDFISKMVSIDPRKRWTAERLLSHPWLSPILPAFRESFPGFLP